MRFDKTSTIAQAYKSARAKEDEAHPYKIYEFDSVSGEKAILVETAPDMETAMEIAKKVAELWCEDEKPQCYRRGVGTDRNAHHVVCLGYSDFGALIEYDAPYEPDNLDKL